MQINSESPLALGGLDGYFIPVPRYHDSLEEFQGGIILIDFVESCWFSLLNICILSVSLANSPSFCYQPQLHELWPTNKNMSTIKKRLSSTLKACLFSSVGYVSDFLFSSFMVSHLNLPLASLDPGISAPNRRIPRFPPRLSVPGLVPPLAGILRRFTSANAHGFWLFFHFGFSTYVAQRVGLGILRGIQMTLRNIHNSNLFNKKHHQWVYYFFLSLISVYRVYHYFANVASAQSCWLHHLFKLSSNVTKSASL